MKRPSPRLIVTSIVSIVSIVAVSGAACSKKEAAPEPTKAPATVAPANTDKAPDPAPVEPQADAAKAAEPDVAKAAEPDAEKPAEADGAAAVDPAGGGLAGGTQPASAVEVAEMPALYAPLFKDEAAVFAWSFEVDTHDAEAKDPVARVTATVTCRPKVTTMAEARLAQVACEVTDKKGELELPPALDRVWIATRDGLWLAGSTPDDPAGLAEILKTKAILTPNPTAFEVKTEADPDKDIAGSTTQLAQDGEAWCHAHQMDGMYGAVGDTWCFAPDKGLVKVDMLGREGPSTESYVRK